MSSKVLLLKYLPHFPKATIPTSSTARRDHDTKTAIVLRLTENHISIQGYPPVPWKDKHKGWSLFQQAAKQLLAVPNTTSVCICFAEPPYTPVSSLSTLLEQPNTVLDLIVSPLPSSSSHLTPSCEFGIEEPDFGHKADTRDPYCRYREMYRPYCTSGSAVRQRCDFAEMNRLFSQLNEVSLCLQRTQDECERIAKRCGPSKSTSTSSTSSSDSKSQSESDKDSGKGSSPPVSGDDTRATEGTDSGKSAVGRPLVSAQDSAADEKVVKLIGTANSILHQLHGGTKKTGLSDGGVHASTISKSCPSLSTNSHLKHNAQTQLPDSPSDVCARPSFTPGGAYIMWNPVSLDAEDSNNGQKVLGYLVLVNSELGAEVEGPLASQVELTHMKHNTDYQIQVCTRGEHSNSVLSQLLVYKHTEPHQLASSETSRPAVTKQDSKTARVESWLKNGTVSESSHTDTTVTDLLPVHLTKEICPTSVDFPDHTEIDCITRICPHNLTLVDSCDDTKSIGSSHTSGIVTDYLVSPKLLDPMCDCHNCSSSKLNAFSCTHHDDDDVMVIDCHHGNSPLSTPSRHSTRHDHYHNSTPLNSRSKSTSSTLCPSLSVDTVIDEPLRLGEASHSDDGASLMYVSHNRPRTGYNHFFPVKHTGPAPPQNVQVAGNNRTTTVTVSWSPVERDLKGCSNGCYVLGYRVYLNGELQQSVDGAMTSRSVVNKPHPSNSNPHLLRQLVYYVTTRSMSGESLPSHGAICDVMLQRDVHRAKPVPRSKKLDSVISSTVDSTSMYTKSESVVSHPHSSAAASHPMAKRYRMESYV